MDRYKLYITTAMTNSSRLIIRKFSLQINQIRRMSNFLCFVMNGLNEFIDEIARLVEDGERQYGVANATYTEY